MIESFLTVSHPFTCKYKEMFCYLKKLTRKVPRYLPILCIRRLEPTTLTTANPLSTAFQALPTKFARLYLRVSPTQPPTSPPPHNKRSVFSKPTTFCLGAQPVTACAPDSGFESGRLGRYQDCCWHDVTEPCHDMCLLKR